MNRNGIYSLKLQSSNKILFSLLSGSSVPKYLRRGPVVGQAGQVRTAPFWTSLWHLGTCLYLSMFVFKKQSPSNKSMLKNNLEKSGSPTAGRGRLWISAAKLGPHDTREEFKELLCPRRQSSSPQSSQTNTDDELGVCLPPQCSSDPTSN